MKMENIIQKSFRVNLFLMRFLNLYPPERTTVIYKLKAYCSFFILLVPVPVLGFVYLMCEEDLTIEQLGDNAFLVAQLGCQITKYLPFITKGSRIKKCIHYLGSSQFISNVKKQKEIIDDSSWICRRNSMVFLVSVVGGIIFLAIRPLFSNNQNFPTDIWLPFEPTADIRIFVFVYMFVVSGIAYAGLSCAAIDPLIGGLACLTIGQLEVLKDNLKNLNEYAETIYQEKYRTSTNNTERIFIVHEIIQKCVDRHNAILTFISEFEACFSMSVFSQLVGSILVICFSCFQLSKLDPSSFNFIATATFLSLLLVQIYIYCYYGTMLFEESNSLSDAIYMGSWYEADMKSKKSLIILMERSKRPIILNTGKIVEISIDTFTTILRRSYSLLAVLKNF